MLKDTDASFGIIDAHQPIGSFRKGSIGDSSDANLDSGYMTNWSISQSQITTSSSRLNNSSFKRSFDLIPITENIESQFVEQQAKNVSTSFATIETPTTKSIRQLDAFHINTPQNLKNQSETTPTKANYFANVLNSGSKSGRKKCRISWSPYQASPSKKHQKSFEQLNSPNRQGNLSDANNENNFDGNVQDQSIGFSPIETHNASNAMSEKLENQHTIQRYPSGIESSTPKKLSELRRIHTQSIVRARDNAFDDSNNRMLRKTQSFSPAKMVLRELNFQNRIETETNASEIDDASAYNPARKMLEFTNQQFGQLLESHPPATFQTPTKLNAASTSSTITSKDFEVPTTPVNRSPCKLKARSRFIKEFSRKRSMKPSSSAATSTNKFAGSLNESDISMSMSNDAHEQQTKTKSAVKFGIDFNLMDTNESMATSSQQQSNKTPNINQDIKDSISDTPNRDDSIRQNIREEANRTPIKRFERSISYNPLSVKSSPEKEKHEIIYGHLPCTPPKKYIRRSLKRPASSLADTTTHSSIEPSAKRKLYESYQRTKYYNGRTKLDIITLLANFNLFNIITGICDHLSDRELQATRSTCKSWSNIIKKDNRNNARRLKFVKALRSVKENSYQRRKYSAPNININNNNNNNNTSAIETIKRKPFNIANVTNDEEHKPIPVSPSTRKFRENQEVCCNSNPKILFLLILIVLFSSNEFRLLGN